MRRMSARRARLASVFANGPVDAVRRLAASAPAGGTAARATFVVLFLLALLYRVRLGLTLGDTFASEVPAPLRAVLRQLGADALFALAAASIVFLGAQLGALLGIAQGRSVCARALRGVAQALWGVLLLLFGVLSQTQHGVFFATGNGLTVELLRESLEWAALREAVSLLSPLEIGVILSPLALWALLLTVPARGRRGVERAVFALSAMALLFAVVRPAAPLPDALLHHPVAYVLVEMGQRARAARMVGEANAANARNGLALDPGTLLGPLDPTLEGAGEDGNDDAAGPWQGGDGVPVMALSSSSFVFGSSERPVKKALPGAAGKKPYHVVYIVMESTGFDLALRPLSSAGVRGNDDVAMPFLHSLTGKGLFLTQHYSSGNSSPRGIFSLLSGLYVMPEVAIFDVRKDNHLPSLVSYLGDRYRRFLVTPGSLDWYFPHAFLLHSGMSELWGYHALPVRKNAPGGRSHARDEAESVSFFLRRFDEQVSTGAPVLAVYYSFVAHWPYPDYGESTHATHPTRPQNAYCNNLRYLDQQIERIYKHLEARGLLDDTIVVLAGDHGEAFGQHPHNYTHSRMSYNENVRTPALLLNRGLFPPRVVTAPTSHVDIVPTLLDALAIPHDAARLQGESLFQDRFRRKYIFFYGNEDTLSSVSADALKLQVSLRDGSCWAFDLRGDPEERRRLGCAPYREQQQALLQYRRHQQAALRRYNQLAKRGLPLFPAPSTAPAVAALGPASGPGGAAALQTNGVALQPAQAMAGLERSAPQVDADRQPTAQIASKGKRRRSGGHATAPSRTGSVRRKSPRL